MNATPQSEKAASTERGSGAYTAEELAAMKERAKEVRAEKKAAASGKADLEGEVLAKIAEMPEPDRGMAERIHAIVRAAAPGLAPRLWYGMPAYAKDGKVLCFFQPASKFKARYSTLGFNDVAQLDDGAMWPAAFALTQVTAAEEAQISELVERAAR